MTRLAATLLVLSLAACGPAAPEDDDAGTSGNNEADGGSGADAGEPIAINCISMHGVHSANTKWTYRWAASNRVGARNAKVTALNDNKNEATVETSESWTQTTGGVSVSGTTTEKFRCTNAGLYLLSSHSVSSQTVVGNTTNSDTTTTYDPPRFLRPNGPVLNDTWTSDWTGTRVSTSGSTPVSGSESWSVTEDGIGITGGFRGIRIKSTTGPNEYLWQQGYGVLYDVTWWLSTHTP